MPRNPEHILAAIVATPWMISEEGLQQIYSIAIGQGDIEAVRAQIENLGFGIKVYLKGSGTYAGSFRRRLV